MDFFMYQVIIYFTPPPAIWQVFHLPGVVCNMYSSFVSPRPDEGFAKTHTYTGA